MWVSCKRLLSISAPASDSHPDMDNLSLDLQDYGPQTVRNIPSTSGQATSSTSYALTAHLNPSLILRKMDALESKNCELKAEINSREGNSRILSRLSHSSPTRSHKRTKLCASKGSNRSRIVHTSFSQDSSDEDSTADLPNKESYYHYAHASNASSTVRDQISVDFLRRSRCSQKVQKQLEKMQGRQRTATPRN